MGLPRLGRDFHSRHFSPSKTFISSSSQDSQHLTPLSLTSMSQSAELSISTQYYRHGRLRVSGGVIPDAITAYRTYGNPANPCIIFPTCYGGKLEGEFNHFNHLKRLSDCNVGVIRSKIPGRR